MAFISGVKGRGLVVYCLNADVSRVIFSVCIIRECGGLGKGLGGKKRSRFNKNLSMVYIFIMTCKYNNS